MESRLKQLWGNEQANCVSGLVSLLHRLALGRQLSEKGPKAGGRTWRMAVFVAEVEIEAGPLVVVRALGHGHSSPFQPPFKGYPGFCGNRLHRNLYGR
jgi:hypothetical protein